jgi:pyruvate formate lyase activating enzyme
MGCNFRCSFCQNYQLSQIQDKQGRILGDKYGPAELVGLAVKENCKSVAYTYSEPTIFYELARDTMVKAHEAGLHNVFVTNGYMSPEMIADSKGLIDAANVDIKAFDQEFYKKYVKARLEGVLESARLLKENGVWLEITTLLIPGANDDEDELKGLASFIKTELGPDTPWHVSRFHPNYKEDGIPPTPAQSLNRAAEIGKERGLNYVYVGNISPNTYENTYCPQCGELLMERVGFTMADYNIKSGRCSQCSHTIPGVGL